jgi:signal peptide peptidase SppA
MIHYPHIIMAAAGEVWAMQREKFDAIVDFLALKAHGGDVSAEELARITKTQERQVAASDGEVAILPVFGTIAPRMNMMTEISGGTSTMMLAGAFRQALADSNVKAIVFDHDSPGGLASGTGELASEILDSRGVKPIIAQVDHLSASASYWLASAADEIVVTPGGQGGSIGVYQLHEDVSKMLETKGVRPTIIRSSGSPYKIEANDIEPLTQDARDHIQQRVDQTFDRMVRSIAAGRGTTLSAVKDRFGQGRVFGAEELVSRGMADRIDTLEGTLERLTGGSFNPVAAAARNARTSRAEAGNVLLAKLKARHVPSTQEWEQGLRVLAGLSRSESKFAVATLRKGLAQCDAGDTTAQPAVSIADLAELREGMADIRRKLAGAAA